MEGVAFIFLCVFGILGIIATCSIIAIPGRLTDIRRVMEEIRDELKQGNSTEYLDKLNFNDFSKWK